MPELPESASETEASPEDIQTPEALQSTIVSLDRKYATVSEAIQDESFDIQTNLTQLSDRVETLKADYNDNPDALMLLEEAASMITDLQGDLDDITGDFSIDQQLEAEEQSDIPEGLEMRTISTDQLPQILRTFLDDQGYNPDSPLITSLDDNQLAALKLISLGSESAFTSGGFSLFKVVESHGSIYLTDMKTAGELQFRGKYQELSEPQLQFIQELETLGFSLDENIGLLDEAMALAASSQEIPTAFIDLLRVELAYDLDLSDIAILGQIDGQISDKDQFISFAKQYLAFTGESCTPEALNNSLKLYKIPNAITLLTQCPNTIFRQIGYTKYAPSLNTFIAFCHLINEPEFNDLDLSTLTLVDIQSKIDSLDLSRKQELARKIYEEGAGFCMGEIVGRLNFNDQGMILNELLGDDFSDSLNSFNDEKGLSLETVGINKSDQVILTNTFKGTNKMPLLFKLSLQELKDGDCEALLATAYEQELTRNPEETEIYETGSHSAFDIAGEGQASVLLLVTYPNSTRETYQDDLQRKQSIYTENYGVDHDNLSVAEVENMDLEQIFALIGESIQDAIDQGQSEFVLEYMAHGYAGGEIGIGGHPLDATKLAELLNKYADKIKITILSHTCRGGWQVAKMQEVFAQNEDLQGVMIYSASGINSETTTFEPHDQLIHSNELSQDSDNPYDYYFALAYEMNPDLSFTQARIFASRMIEEHFPTNPQGLYIGPPVEGMTSEPYDIESEMDDFEANNPDSGSGNYSRIPVPQNPDNYSQEVYRIS